MEETKTVYLNDENLLLNIPGYNETLIVYLKNK